MLQESRTLFDAGLDFTIPFRASGIDTTKLMAAINNSVFILIQSGIHWTTALYCMDRLKEYGMDLPDNEAWSAVDMLLVPKYTANSRAVMSLMIGLRDGGKTFDFFFINKILEQAGEISNVGISPAMAYKAAGVDVGIIPVDKDKYYKLLMR